MYPRIVIVNGLVIGTANNLAELMALVASTKTK